MNEWQFLYLTNYDVKNESDNKYRNEEILEFYREGITSCVEISMFLVVVVIVIVIVVLYIVVRNIGYNKTSLLMKCVNSLSDFSQIIWQ